MSERGAITALQFREIYIRKMGKKRYEKMIQKAGLEEEEAKIVEEIEKNNN